MSPPLTQPQYKKGAPLPVGVNPRALSLGYVGLPGTQNKPFPFLSFLIHWTLFLAPPPEPPNLTFGALKPGWREHSLWPSLHGSGCPPLPPRGSGPIRTSSLQLSNFSQFGSISGESRPAPVPVPGGRPPAGISVRKPWPRQRLPLRTLPGRLLRTWEGSRDASTPPTVPPSLRSVG
uniref:Uncharacterized protein n=1 Tax=Myotis myotis TaxID=51298 RepID=A0A7J7Y021_MYOMY|nr:hypothetical protein mMyoMyo1_011497 [Myotis myotis]